MDGITLQLVTESDPVAWSIRFLTWSRFSHVDVVLPDGRLLGARCSGGVQIREPNHDYIGIKRYFVECDPAPVLKYALSQVGKPYDWIGIANFFLHRSHFWRETDAWFCSELVAAAFAFSGYPLLSLSDCDHVTPRDITVSPYVKPMVVVDGEWVLESVVKAAGA